MQISRGLTLPDPVRINRYQRLPELGPRILFFSGGSALNQTARALKTYTHNSIHLVTPFDSGGSSAVLRRAFGMPAIGDLRSRLMALADETVLGHPEVIRLFTHRLPKQEAPEELLHTLLDMVGQQHPLINQIPNPMRDLICNQLEYFLDAMPKSFDLRGASIGNLILAGGYLNNSSKLEPILFLFSKLVNVRGAVTPIVNARLHLGAELQDGQVIIGQHRMTGKEEAPLTSPIADLFLTRSLDHAEPTTIELSPKKRSVIDQADLICYPPGSFFSSLLANLLPTRVGKAIADNPNPKVYIPNLGKDPEQLGLSPTDCILRLLSALRRDAGQDVPTNKLLSLVLCDPAHAAEFDQAQLDALGIPLITTPLLKTGDTPASAKGYDEDKLVCALLSLT